MSIVLHFQCTECEFEAQGENGPMLARTTANHTERTGHLGEAHVDNADGSCSFGGNTGS